jgi:hypothetical protein
VEKPYASSVPESPTGANELHVKRAQPEDPDMLEHYDFTGGVRGKYVGRFAEGSNVVVLDPDVAAMFTDAESVNQTLRAVGRIIKQQNRKQQKSTARRTTTTTLGTKT